MTEIQGDSMTMLGGRRDADMTEAPAQEQAESKPEAVAEETEDKNSSISLFTTSNPFSFEESKFNILSTCSSLVEEFKYSTNSGESNISFFINNSTSSFFFSLSPILS